MDLKYVLKIFIIVFLIFALIVFINSIGLNLKIEEQPRELIKVVTIEGFEKPDTSIIINSSDAFCQSYRGSSGELDDACGKMTRNNCTDTSCCVWTSDDKCRAGNASGPTFNSDENGKTRTLDYYYFQGKCYGEKCPVL
jgi:hypothetical protein